MRAIAVLGLAACGGVPRPARARPPVHPPRLARWSLGPDEVAVPRPTVDAIANLVPDLTEELRWPLPPSVHPDLEPAFPVAAQLADEGVTWQDLCRMGAQHRHLPGRKAQLVAYLGAWCSAAGHDDDEAVAQLASLGSTTIDGLADALPIDLADLLADAGSADHAEHLIAQYDLRDVAVLDDLAAVYVELGQPEAARAINHDAIDLGTRSREADQCHRAARDIVLGPELSRLLELQDLETVHLKGRKVQDPTCAALDRKLACWMKPGAACVPYFRAQRMGAAYAELLEAYEQWPDGPADYGSWLAIAREAAAAAGLPGAQELGHRALTAAVEVSSCWFTSIQELDVDARLLDGATTVVDAAFQRFCSP